MDLRTLGGFESFGASSYFSINYAARSTPFVLRDSRPDTAVFEINGRLLPMHNGALRLPITVGDEELTDISVEPTFRRSFTHGGKVYEITAYLGTQKYEPPQSWPWSFRWSELPPYYLPSEAVASFDATPFVSVCTDALIVWLNEKGQMLGLPAYLLSTSVETGEAEMIQKKRFNDTSMRSFFELTRTPAGMSSETLRLSTPPLTSEDIRVFGSLGAARYSYIAEGGKLTPIDVSGTFSWSCAEGGRCATFDIRVYKKQVTYGSR